MLSELVRRPNLLLLPQCKLLFETMNRKMVLAVNKLLTNISKTSFLTFISGRNCAESNLEVERGYQIYRIRAYNTGVYRKLTILKLNSCSIIKSQKSSQSTHAIPCGLLKPSNLMIRFMESYVIFQ